MAKIVLIDDDYALGILEENLSDRGHSLSRYKSASEALSALERILEADLVILDVIMERPVKSRRQDISGGQSTGMLIYRKLRSRKPDLPILVLSATQNQNHVETIARDKKAKFISKWNARGLKELTDLVESLVGRSGKEPRPVVFIVHGQDEVAKLSVKNYLQNALGLPEPIVLHEQPNLGRTIIEKFEEYASLSTMAVVLLTPDDKVAAGEEENCNLYRARQNVIFETGYLLGVLGRRSGRVLLLYKGRLDLPSDISGLVYIDISSGIESAGEQVRRELQNVLSRNTAW